MVWIEKTNPPHYCQQPEPGDHYDMDFGGGSIWQCDICREKWIFHPLLQWERLEEHDKRLARWDAEAKARLLESGRMPKRWWQLW